jgi:HEPN domain-containing protein
MLKKILLVSAVLVFAFGVLFASVWKTSAQSQSENSLNFSVKGEAISVSLNQVDNIGERIDYELPWPGLLPDHFLYPIKMLRDRIWLELTTDPLERAELLLKLADKRLWAAQMLIEEGKNSLAVTTATKAEKYLQRALDQEQIAREDGNETNSFLEKLAKATLKHEEILLEIQSKTEGEAKTVINDYLSYPREGHNKVLERLGTNS